LRLFVRFDSSTELHYGAPRAGADWPLWQCGNCREAFLIKFKMSKKEAFEEF
jgi:hypothetical protein